MLLDLAGLAVRAVEQTADGRRVWLATTAWRCLSHSIRGMRAALGPVRREAYVGPWLPEPLLSDPYQDPERSAELADSVSMAALLLLERLSPLERAVFVLREVFGFGFPEVASAVGGPSMPSGMGTSTGCGSYWPPTCSWSGMAAGRPRRLSTSPSLKAWKKRPASSSRSSRSA